MEGLKGLRALVLSMISKMKDLKKVDLFVKLTSTGLLKKTKKREEREITSRDKYRIIEKDSDDREKLLEKSCKELYYIEKREENKTYLLSNSLIILFIINLICR
jgi:hypothetical protein